jgi:hypothetical protein
MIPRLWEEDILEWLRLGTHEELKYLAADRDSYRAAVIISFGNQRSRCRPSMNE